MGILLHNVIPIDVGAGSHWNESWTTHEEAQGIETYPYTSLSVSALGCTSSDSNWSHTGGVMPPGLSVIAGTGVVTGTIDSFSSSQDLVRMLELWPAKTVPLTNVDQMSYDFGAGGIITKTFDFNISGFNTSIPSSPTVVSFTIIVLRDWTEAVKDWQKEDIYVIGAK